MFQRIRDFKTRYLVPMKKMYEKYISTARETFKLSLNIRIILSFNKLQLLPKRQFENYFAKNLNSKPAYIRQQNFIFYMLRPLSKNVGNIHSCLANHIAHIFMC